VIYHILSESEPFSDVKGGALSRWVGNIAKDSGCVVVCPEYDETWGFPPEKILCLEDWRSYGKQCEAIPRGLYIVPFLSAIGVLDPLRAVIPVFRPGDVVWVHNRTHTAAYLEQRISSPDVQIVLHLQNSQIDRLSRLSMKRLQRTRIVFCSEFLRTEALQLDNLSNLETFVLHNGADEHRFKSQAQSHSRAPRIVFVGRLIPEKGVDVLLSAMRILQGRGIEAECVVIGGDQDGKRNQAYAASLRRCAPTNTRFAGYLSGEPLAAAMREADIFCCPSVWNEAFGMVIVEAMASGLPVVASRVGGIPEILASGGGVLVAPQQAEELAGALEGLITNKSRRLEMAGQAKRSFHARFTWTALRAKYFRVVEHITQSFEAPRESYLSTS
jgi:spore coat protein SA